jgi:mannose/fructose/N-acetylgalactosamine-specific phosphotransferase system component IIC
MGEFQLILGLSLLAGALALDETAALQIMVSQPLVAGAVAGAAAGAVPLGLAIGGTLQLVWSAVLPVGAAPFPDAAVASVSAVGVAVLLSRAGADAALAVGVGVMTGLAAGVFGQRVILHVRRINTRHAEFAVERAREGDAGGTVAAVVRGIGTRLVGGAATAGLFLTAGGIAARVVAAGDWSLAVPGGVFPTLLWAAPVACAGIAASSRGATERLLILAGFAAGLAFASGP